MNTCSSYMKRQMERYPVLNDQKQLELLKQAQEGDDNAREDLILCNLRLVRTVAQQLGVPTHWEMDDLIAEGIQGITYAIDKFDLEKGVKPSTYFWNAIKWKILKFKEEVGEPMLSLNETISTEDEEDKTEYLDRVPDPYAAKLMRDVETMEDLRQMLRYVPLQEQAMLILRYGLFGFDQYSLDDIGTATNLSHAGVRHACNRAIEKMQEFPEVPPWYDLVTRDEIQKLIDHAGILSKGEKVDSKRATAPSKAELVPDAIDHNYSFRSGIILDTFQKEFGDRIRSDYTNGRSIRNLALKYNCPRSQIAKAIRGLKELKLERQKRRQSNVYDKVEHDYTFKKGHMAPEFQKEFGDQIRADYKQKRSVRNLSLKYNCPRSQIQKAVRDGMRK